MHDKVDSRTNVYRISFYPTVLSLWRFILTRPSVLIIIHVMDYSLPTTSGCASLATIIFKPNKNLVPLKGLLPLQLGYDSIYISHF